MSVAYLVFRYRIHENVKPPTEELNARNLVERCWRPRFNSMGPPGFKSYRWLFWWAMNLAGRLVPAFFAPGIVHIRMLCTESGEQVFRAGIYPARWQRPFMTRDSVEIGVIYVPPQWRRRGLAKVGICNAIPSLPPEIKQVYYICRTENVQSIALAKSCGFEFVARAKRESSGIFGRIMLAEGHNSANQ